jgi:acyl dehydratase
MSEPALKPTTFELMQVGEELGPIELVVDDHYIKRFAFCHDDYHPWCLGTASPFGGRVGHAAILVPELLRLLNTRYDPDTDIGVHQKEEIWLHSPVHIDEPIVCTGAFVDRYVKRDKGYIVTNAEARSRRDGRLLVRHRSTEIARIDPNVQFGSGSAPPAEAARRAAAVFPTDREPVARATPDMPVGTPVLGPVKHLHQDQMSVFSNVQSFWHNIHNDRDVARAAGSERTIAQGLMESMYLSELGTTFFGRSWFETGWTFHTFLHPVYAGDELTTRAVVSGHPDSSEGPRLELEAWQENQDGVKVVVGWLSAVVGGDATEPDM